MTLKQYEAIRRVSRLDYLIVVLENAEKGYEHESALRDIQNIQANLEAERARALGKQKPRPVSGGAVLAESEKMALQLRFALRTAHGLALTPDGKFLLSTLKGQRSLNSSDIGRATIIARFWQVYPKFGETLLAILQQPNATMDLPMPTDASFQATAKKLYALDCDAVSFKIIREIASELGLLNWHILDGDKRLQRVYVLAYINELDFPEKPEYQSRHQNNFSGHCLDRFPAGISSVLMQEEFIELEVGFGKTVMIEGHGKFIIFAALDKYFLVIPYEELTIDKFEEQLWKTYLELANYRSLYPITYPKIRNEVCFHLHISDERFDTLVKELIKAPRRVKVFPSTGILDYSRDLAHLYKHLPPQSEGGQFITFLKLAKMK